MSAPKNKRTRKNDTSSSPPTADITPTLNEKSAQQTIIEQIEISLGRKPVKDTQINRKTGKVVTYDRFKSDGLVVVRCLESAFRALQMYDGRLRYQDEPSPLYMCEAAYVAYMRADLAEYDAKHGPEPAGADNVVAGQQNQDRQQNDPGSCPPPADITPTLNEKWAWKALVEQIEISLGRKPVKETRIDRRTGKVITFDQFKPDGLVAARCLEIAFRALQMFDGRLRYQDEKLAPCMSSAENISYMRAYVAKYDAQNGPPPTAADTADRPDVDHHQPDGSEAEPKVSQQEKPDPPTRKLSRRNFPALHWP